MDVVVEDVSALTKKITITLPKDGVQKKLEKAYGKLQRETKMKGFRRGKVPRTVIVKHYQGQVQAEVGEKLVQDSYFDAIEKEKIDPVVHPEITDPVFNEDGTFTFVASIDIRPDFELGEYKGIEVEKVSNVVSDAAVEIELEELRRDMAPLKSVEDRAIENGDVIVVDFEGFNNGKAMKEVKNENYSVDVGAGKLSPEFEEKLLGMKKGEEASHEVEFPAEYVNPVLAGKKVEFRVKVKDVKERVLPELDDNFAKDVDEKFTSLAELQSDIRAKLQAEKDKRAEGDTTDRVMLKLLEGHVFEVPERLVRFEVEEMIKNTEKTLEQQGMNLESAGINREELAAQSKETAEKRVRGDFILKKIAETEDIKVKDEDLNRAFQRIGDQYNMAVAQVKEFFQSRDDLLPFMNEILNEKILTFLRENANFVDAAPAAKEVAVEEVKTESAD
ncbi:trigger factor [Desulfocapsa sulfexigens DSM 10523]|uniref:Trigger factor n=1 Tax=Desulfocapsa sulfexigens (strain DSM 10523 / SB164P1) TaxID=1167006 RepID=M1P749_DESSD|nr:trigger factor [Desulfocapsa sulfexigens]AGF79303.1 trigger factor [Desulfocapsa sulfexigens DSM 10523]